MNPFKFGKIVEDDFFTDRESAILFGIPSNFIEGILVGRVYEKDKDILDEIKKIADSIGRVIDYKAFYDYWNATDFLDKSGFPINLKQKIVSWSLKDNNNKHQKVTKPQAMDDKRKQMFDELEKRFGRG